MHDEREVDQDEEHKQEERAPHTTVDAHVVPEDNRSINGNEQRQRTQNGSANDVETHVLAAQMRVDKAI